MSGPLPIREVDHSQIADHCKGSSQGVKAGQLAFPAIGSTLKRVEGVTTQSTSEPVQKLWPGLPD